MSKLSTDELKLVARHASGDLEQSLAIVQLAKRRGRLSELLEVVGGDDS